MTFGFLLGVAVPWAIGALTLRLVWPLACAASFLSLLRIALGFFLGAGIVSLQMVLAMLVFGSLDQRLPLLELGTLCLLTILNLVRRVPSEPGSEGASMPTLVMAIVGLTVLGFVLEMLETRSRAFLHGGWDAWSIWNARARFLYLGGTEWRAGFCIEAEAGHPDYPLLLMGMVCQLWCWIGEASERASASLGILSTVMTSALVLGAVGAMRGGFVGWMAFVAWFGSWNLLRRSYEQCADIPMSACCVASVVLLELSRTRSEKAILAALSGAFTLAAAWTKNEGIVFALVMLATVTLTAWRRLWAFATGAAPFAAVLIWFKWNLAPANDLVLESSGESLLNRLTDMSRIAKVGGAFATELIWFGEPLSTLPLLSLGMLPILILAALGGIWWTHPAERRQAAVPLAIFTVMALAYSVVYVLTPKDLDWHLNSSLDRLVIQIWPVAILGLCLCLPGRRDDAPSDA